MGFQPKENFIGNLGLKIVVFGDTGSGKSKFAGSFPKVNLVDSESGQQLYLKDNPNIIGYLPTQSKTEIENTMKELKSDKDFDNFDTLVVDSGTKVYENMQAVAYEIAEKRTKKNLLNDKGDAKKKKVTDLEDLNLTQRDWGHIKRWGQDLSNAYITYSDSGKNVIVTAHEKIVTDGDGDSKRIIGYKPDLQKKAEYDFDIVIRLHNKDEKGNFITDADGNIVYLATILKDRTGVCSVNDILKNEEISYDTWREYLESNKTKKARKSNIDLNASKDIDRREMEFESDDVDTIVKEIKDLMAKLCEDEDKKTNVMKEFKNSSLKKELSLNSYNELEKFLDKLKEM